MSRRNKREKAGRHGKKLGVVLIEAVNMLAADALLPRRYFDHSLSGEWSDHRDCHIRPDLVLRFTENQTTIISSSCVSVRIANLACRRSVPDYQQDEAGLAAKDLARETALSVATIRRSELSDSETSMTAANNLAVRRALEMAGVEFIDENGGPGVRLRKLSQGKSRK